MLSGINSLLLQKVKFYFKKLVEVNVTINLFIFVQITGKC